MRAGQCDAGERRQSNAAIEPLRGVELVVPAVIGEPSPRAAEKKLLSFIGAGASLDVGVDQRRAGGDAPVFEEPSLYTGEAAAGDAFVGVCIVAVETQVGEDRLVEFQEGRLAELDFRRLLDARSFGLDAQAFGAAEEVPVLPGDRASRPPLVGGIIDANPDRPRRPLADLEGHRYNAVFDGNVLAGRWRDRREQPGLR